MENQFAQICKKCNLKLLILFGSEAAGKSGPRSDVDLAVLPEEQKPDKLKLIFELGTFFDREIDLVVLHVDTDPTLLHEIYAKGKPLYEKYEGLFDEQHLRAWKIYQDTEKFRLWQAEYLKRKAERMKANVTSNSPS